MYRRADRIAVRYVVQCGDFCSLAATQFLLLAIACDPISESDEPPTKMPIFRYAVSLFYTGD